MKRFLGGTVVVLITALAPASAVAQAFPVKPVRLVVAFAPGGATDTFSRVTAAEMSKSLGQQVLVENRPGAGTTIAAEFIAKSPPDGYTLLFTDLSTHAITPSIYPKLPYHPLRDFVAVAPVSVSPMIMVAHPSVGVKSARELIALAKKHPGITCGNAGIGTVTHMAAEKFRMRAGIDITPVNYKGGATSTISLLTGEIALIVTTIPAALEYVRTKRLVAIGLTAEKRSALLPEVPTSAESGRARFKPSTWHGVFLPPDTPKTLCSYLNAALVKAISSKEMNERFLSQGAEPVGSTPEQFAAFVRDEIAKWAIIVKASGATVD